MSNVPWKTKPLFPAILDNTHPLSQGLGGYWLFNEGAGLTAFDVSGKKKHGTLTNGPTWTAGKFGKAINFDGSNDYVSTGASTPYQGTNISISLWARNTSTSNNSLFGAAADSSASRINAHLPYSGVVYWDFGRITSGGRLSKIAPTLTDGWHHWVFWASGGNSMKIYLDGAEWATQASGDSAGYTGSSTFSIGSFLPSSLYFNGRIDNVRIYNRALSESDVKQLYTDPFAGFSQAKVSITGLPSSSTTATDIFDGKIIIKNSGTNLLDGKVQVKDVITSLIDGKVSIGSIQQDLLDGKLRIKDTAVTVLDGKVNIKDVATSILDGKLQIKDVITSLLDGKVSIGAIQQDLLDGKLTIKDSVATNLDGKLTIKDVITSVLDGKLTVGNIATSLLDGKLTVKDTSVSFLDGKVIVKDIATSLLDGKLEITQGGVETASIDGKLRIKDALTALVDGKVIVKSAATDILDGKLTIGTMETSLLDGKLQIKDIATALLDGKIQVKNATVSLLDGKIVIEDGVTSFSSNNQLLIDSIGGKVLQLGNTRINTWNTAGRPASPKTGTIGLNTQTVALDIYDGAAWKSVTLS